MTTLLVASTGGHLAELHDLVPRLGVRERRWVTFDSPQSRSLLDGEDVVHVPPATSRDLVGAVRDLLIARKMFRGSRHYEQVISTGASVAMSFFVPATAAGVQCSYIESATRTEGPSLTGRMAARLPHTRMYTQHRSWADETWRYGGSIFDAFTAEPVLPRPVRKVVVTLGTHGLYTFPRLLTRLVEILPPGLEVLWQVGATVIERMPPDARAQVPIRELRQAMREADVVVSHAGVGSALAAMQAGRRALYVPRRSAYGEHVDDHQVGMARELESRDLVLAREAGDVTFADLETAAAWSVRSASRIQPFRLTPVDSSVL